MLDKELNSYQLKWIAILTMTMDHAYKMFGVYWVSGRVDSLFDLLISVIFTAGTVTIYIFMWFVAEGCRHTRNKKTYILRLFLFGVVAEIPFQLMINIIIGEPLTLRFGLTNVMFTLALGAAACYGHRCCKGKRLLSFVVPIAFAVLAYILKTDYSWFGVLGIFILYLIKDRKKRLVTIALMAVVFTGLIEPLLDILYYGFNPGAIPIYAVRLAFALAAYPLLSLYRGQRGKKMKYFFYLYYPLHISVLVLLYVFLC